MKTQHTETYESQQACVFEVKAEGIVCVSPTKDVNPNNPFSGNTEQDW